MRAKREAAIKQKQEGSSTLYRGEIDLGVGPSQA